MVDRLVVRSFRVARRAVLALAIGLGACSTLSTLHGEVTRLHRWTAAEPLTFAFDRTEAQSDGLEHRSYESRVRDRLVALGFVPADPDAARYRVVLDWSATPVPMVVTDSLWAWGGWPYGAWPGPLPHHRYRGIDPYWLGPPMTVSRTTTAFRHVLRIELHDARAPRPEDRRVWESSASALAATEAMPRLMPGLVDAALAEFPGDSGTSRPVAVPVVPR